MKNRDKNTDMFPARKNTTFKTSLYELIELVSAEIRPGEEKLVPIIVNHILETGQSVY
jgi:hypothetical protein